MNQRLATAALAAIQDPEIEGEKGMCSKFVRQTVEKAFGSKYRTVFGASALDTANLFKRNKLAVAFVQAGKLQPGDILFKTVNDGPFGHVGIYVGYNLVAENSSTSIGRVSEAKGFRTLTAFGPVQLVGRLPEG